MLVESKKVENDTTFNKFLRKATPETAINICLDAMFVIKFKSEDLE